MVYVSCVQIDECLAHGVGYGERFGCREASFLAYELRERDALDVFHSIVGGVVLFECVHHTHYVVVVDGKQEPRFL